MLAPASKSFPVICIKCLGCSFAELNLRIKVSGFACGVVEVENTAAISTPKLAASEFRSSSMAS
jgi:hypothetical protein